MAVCFSLVTQINAPIDRVFDACLDVDVHTASMTASRERAVGGVTSGRLSLGDTVTWRARHFGIWWTMTSRITEFDRPSRFVDEQVHGPFAWYRHEHRFATSDDGTVLQDGVSFQAPAGILGRIVEQFVLRRYLARLIGERNDHLGRLAGGG